MHQSPMTQLTKESNNLCLPTGKKSRSISSWQGNGDRCSWKNRRRKKVAGECWLLLLVLKMLITVFLNHSLLKQSCTIFSHNEKPHSYLIVLYSLLAGSVDYHSVQFSLVAQSCPTLYNPMDCSISGFPIHHQFPELAQTHVHWVSDAIQPSHPMLSHSSPAFNLSQHQGLFQCVSSSHQVARGPEL